MAIRNDLLRDILSAIGGGGAVQWGSIGGNILDQTDLQAEFEANNGENVRIINSESDFDSQTATVITLTPGVFYQIGADISTSKRFVTQGAQMQGLGSAATLTYTGTASMFTNTNERFGIENISISCANGTVFECIGDDTGNPQHRINARSILVTDCEQLLISTGAGAQVFELVQVTNVSGSVAISFSGSTAAVVFGFSRIGFLGLSAGAIGFDFGSVLTQEIELADIVMFGDSTATALSGLVSSGNLTSGNLASVKGCNFSSFTTPLENIVEDDIRWEFEGNAGVANSINDGLIHVSSNALETTIGTQGVAVKVNGVFTAESVGRFTSDGTGRLTFTGERSVRLPIDATASLLMASGGDKQVSLCIAINGVVVDATCVQETASNNKGGSASTMWQHSFETNDYVELFVSNESNTENIIVTQAVFRVN